MIGLSVSSTLRGELVMAAKKKGKKKKK